VYRHKDKLAPLHDLVHIECSSKRKTFGMGASATVEEGPPLPLIIDPNRNRLLRRDRSQYFETKKFDDNEILALKEDDRLTSTIRIDRISGSYRWTIDYKRQPPSGSEYWGKCIVVEPGQKF
jgi:hypothetical protein